MATEIHLDPEAVTKMIEESVRQLVQNYTDAKMDELAGELSGVINEQQNHIDRLTTRVMRLERRAD